MRQVIATILFVLAVAVAGGQTINDCHHEVSHGWVRVTCDMSSDPSAPTLSYGPTASYGTDLAMEEDNSQSQFTQLIVKMGLSPASTYHYQVCTSGAGTGTCTSDATFTTAAEPSPHPALPTAPTSYSPSYPTINGTAWAGGGTCTVSSDCNSATTGLQKCLDDAGSLSDALNYEVVIPAGMECRGHYEAPNRSSHTGWVVIRGAGYRSATLPPSGVRLTADWPLSTALPSLKPTSYGQYVRYTISGAYATNCGLSGRFMNLNTSGGGSHQDFPVTVCDTSQTYAGATTIASFSGDPGPPITVTVTGHSIVSGNIVDIPTNGYVTPDKYVAFNISGNTFQIDATKIGTYTGGVDLAGVQAKYYHPSYSSGSGDPTGSCTDENWYWDTSSTWDDVWWCAGSAWTERRADASGMANTAALEIKDGGDKWWVGGIAVTIQSTAQEFSSFPTDWDQKTVTNDQGAIEVLVYVAANTTDVVFDQVAVYGRAKPSRVDWAFVFDGAGPYAVWDSTVHELSEWVNDFLPQTGYGGGLRLTTGGPYSIKNNFIESGGISLFSKSVPDAYDEPYPLHDVSIVRNTITRKSAWRRTAGTTNYPDRHPIEFKSLQRALIQGNYFPYQWSEINAGAAITPYQAPLAVPAPWTISSFSGGTITTSVGSYMDPGDVVLISGTGDGDYDDKLFSVTSQTSGTVFEIRDQDGNPPVGSGSTGSVYLRASHARIHDLAVLHNRLFQGTEWMRVDGDQESAQEPLPIERVQVQNNEIVDLNIDSFANGGRVSNNGTYQNGDLGGRVMRVADQVEDFIFRHNTSYFNDGASPCFLCGDEVMEGLDFSDNIFGFNSSGAFQAVRINTTYGEAALDAMFQRDGSGYWTTGNDVVCCNLSANAPNYPSSWDWPAAEANVKWLKPQITAGFNLRLRHDSDYVSGGTKRASDGLDLGVDVDALEQQMGLISNFRIRQITSTSAIASALVPDPSATCTVEVHTAGSSRGTGSRFTGQANDDAGDGTQDRALNINLTGLSTGTDYEAVLMCADAQDEPAENFGTP